jgi:hypothetical protein
MTTIIPLEGRKEFRILYFDSKGRFTKKENSIKVYILEVRRDTRGKFLPLMHKEYILQELEKGRRVVIIRGIEREKILYRSCYALGYESEKNFIEYRVWVHSEEPFVSESQLRHKLEYLLYDVYPISNDNPDALISAMYGVDSEYGAGFELNERIGKDEMMPTNAILNQFYGFARFHKVKPKIISLGY